MGCMSTSEIGISDETIRLGQFLKLASLADTGANAKEMLDQGVVAVNGEVETRRGRQLSHGDVVTVGGVSARVADQDSAEAAADDLPW